MSSEHSLMSPSESPSSHGNPSPSTNTTTTITLATAGSGGGGGSGGKRESSRIKHLQSVRSRPTSRKRSGASTIAADKEGDADGKQNLLDNIPEIAEHFEVISKIGEGTFSSVYLAAVREDRESQFAIKHLVPTSSSARMENEMYCLEKMGGRDHVISLFATVRHMDHVALILNYFKHDKFVDYLPLMGVAEVRLYVRALFEALKAVHSHRIVHRDIKPSNFLYNRTTRRFQLVDFGLAHLETQTREDKGSILKTIQSKGSDSAASSTHTTTQSQTTRANPSAPPTAPPMSYRQRAISRLRANKQSSGNDAKRPSSSTVPTALTLGCRQGKGGASVLLSRTEGGGVLRKAGGGGAMRVASKSGGGREEVRICPQRHKVNFVCKQCLSRSTQVAPRAGTPGFRPPEVLLKYPQQTTAVDMWSAGVILLCLLSKRYPFFKAHDDMSAMAQIVGLFGSQKCADAAKSYKKDLICSPVVQPMDLKKLCSDLRSTGTTSLSDQTQQLDSSTKRKIGSKDRNGPENRNEGSHSSPCKRRRLKSRSRTRSLEPTSHSNDDGTESHSSSWDQVLDLLYDLMLKCLDLNPLTRISAEQALCHDFLVERPDR